MDPWGGSLSHGQARLGNVAQTLKTAPPVSPPPWSPSASFPSLDGLDGRGASRGSISLGCADAGDPWPWPAVTRRRCRRNCVFLDIAPAIRAATTLVELVRQTAEARGRSPSPSGRRPWQRARDHPPVCALPRTNGSLRFSGASRDRRSGGARGPRSSAVNASVVSDDARRRAEARVLGCVCARGPQEHRASDGRGLGPPGGWRSWLPRTCLLTSMDGGWHPRPAYTWRFTARWPAPSRVPVIASGGRRRIDHIAAALEQGGGSASLLASLLHARACSAFEAIKDRPDRQGVAGDPSGWRPAKKAVTRAFYS